MRVLYVGNHHASRAHAPSAGVFVDRQIESLRRAGIEADYFDIGVSFSPRTLFRAWRALRRKVRELRPDLVHAQYGAAVGLVSVLGGAPAVVTFSGTDLHRGGGQMGLLRRVIGTLMSNFAALRARRVICVSDELRRHLWFRRASAAVIPRGVDLSFFTPGPRDQARKELGWPLDRPIVLFAGGRDPVNKGQALAEELVARARRELPQIELHILKGLSPDEMPVRYRAADALLFTSLREGSPNAVKEALACNLPIVSVPVADVEERLAGVEPSRVVPRDPDALATALLEVLRYGRRSNGRERVATISLENIAARVLEVYAEAVR